MTESRRLEGKVALITGAGRGQGRQHAVRLAQEGADIVAIDACRDYQTTTYPMASLADLEETANLVEARGQRVVTRVADVRDIESMTNATQDGVSELGRLDVVCANAGICIAHQWSEVSQQAWDDVIDTNLTGVWNTVIASAPHLITNGGGSIICVSSTGGLKGLPFLAPYVAAKHGVVGIARALANELSEHSIRVNSLHPSHVKTPMMYAMQTDLAPMIEQHPSLGSIFMQSLPMSDIVPDDVSDAVVFLASDDSRFVTGMALTVDAGSTIR